MSQFKDVEVGSTVYFWFAANATTGAAGDGATPLYDVRAAGGAAGDAPTASGTPTLLTHANYTDGLHEIAIDTTGYSAGEYAVFCTLTISTVNPAGFCGSFRVVAVGDSLHSAAARVMDALPNAAAGAAGGLFIAGSNAATTVDIAGTITDVTNQRAKYMHGAVWIGPAANTNTVSYVDGITTNPVSTIAAAKTIADALGLRRFYTVRTGAVQIGVAMTGYDFDGDAWSLTTTGGSRDVSSSSVCNAHVIGGTFASTSAESHWRDCDFSTGVSVAAVHMTQCTFAGTLTLNAAGNYDFVDCASVVAGTSTPEFAIPAGTINVSFRRWSGGISITGITSGTTISIDMVSGGTVTLAGADGDVQIRGMTAGITDNRTGTPTLGQNAAINITKINAECDTALSDVNLDHLVGTSTGIPTLPAGTWLDLLRSDGVATYDRTTDSLQAIRDKLPANLEDLNITDTTGLVRPDMANASGNYAGTVATVTTLTNLPGTAALESTLTAMKGATFSGATDSLEALRDRGDAAWVTATGFATPTNITAASGVSLAAAGLDAVLIESGISAGTGLTDDAGTQLTAVNARQALSALLSALAGVLAGGNTTSITFKPAALPSGNTRITATVDTDNNRTAIVLKVPT
jgi:hypothetical protein